MIKNEINNSKELKQQTTNQKKEKKGITKIDELLFLKDRDYTEVREEKENDIKM